MYNKFLKGVASVLSAALVLSGAVLSVVPAQAKTVNGKSVTYKASELTLSDTMFGECTVADAGNGAVKMTLPSQWNQVFFNIPQEVIDAGWQSVSVETEVTGTNWIKLNDFGSEDGGCRGVVGDGNGLEIQRSADYIDQWGGNPVATEADFDKVTLLCFMNSSEGENVITFKSVTFTTSKEVPGGDSGSKEETKTDDAKTPDTSSKTGESTTMVWVVCILGGLFLMAASGMFVTEQKKRR